MVLGKARLKKMRKTVLIVIPSRSEPRLRGESVSRNLQFLLTAGNCRSLASPVQQAKTGLPGTPVRSG